MNKQRLDLELARRKLAISRSQAESYVKLGKVKVNGAVQTKPGQPVSDEDNITLEQTEQYVSRAGLKLASVSEKLGLNFEAQTVLDVGSSAGGFTDYALRRGATKVIAVDVGTDQLHVSLRNNDRIELHEQTDIRTFTINQSIDIILIDVSFISLREVLPAIAKLANKNTQVVAMVKPQFEARAKDVNKGVIKNDNIRRQILKDFENWVQPNFIILQKSDSSVSGAKGNLERFYLLKKSI